MRHSTHCQPRDWQSSTSLGRSNLKLRLHEELKSFLATVPFFFTRLWIIPSAFCKFALTIFHSIIRLIITKFYHEGNKVHFRQYDLHRSSIRSFELMQPSLHFRAFRDVRNLLPQDWTFCNRVWKMAPTAVVLGCKAWKSSTATGANCIELQITWLHKDSLCALTN